MPTSALIGGLVSGGLGALGSYFGNKTAANAATNAANVQQNIRNQNAATEAPFIQGGQGDFSEYNRAMGTSPYGSAGQQDFFNNFKTDPSYAGVLNAGSRAITNSAAARGTLYGGNTLRDVNDYGGNLLQNAYNSRIDQLYKGAALGGASANALTGSNVTSGNYQGQAMMQAGQYNGNALIGAGNAGIAGLNSYNALNRYNQPYGPDRTQMGYSTNLSDYGGIPTSSYSGNYANLGSF